MDLIRIVNTVTSSNNPPWIYISLDTVEGSSSVGHWIWECALFLPYIKTLQKDTKIPFKILLHEKKLYKTNILSDFGFYEDDIIYSSNMVKDPGGIGTWQETIVYPDEISEYILYLPVFFYVLTTRFDNTKIISAFFYMLNQFRMYYIDKVENIEKTIPISYIARSKVENYKLNSRNFINVGEFSNLLCENSVNIIYTDTLRSLQPQFNDVIKSKIIIVEMGSVFSINVAFIAMNSHIIVINDFTSYDTSDISWIRIFRFLASERDNTVEIFSSATSIHSDFTVDIDRFRRRITELNSSNTA